MKKYKILLLVSFDNDFLFLWRIMIVFEQKNPLCQAPNDIGPTLIVHKKD